MSQNKIERCQASSQYSAAAVLEEIQGRTGREAALVSVDIGTLDGQIFRG